MIDLHTHILPGVDDGAKDLPRALEMAKLASESGVQVVAATPHWDDIPNWVEIKQRVTEFQGEITKAGLDLSVIAAAELFLDIELERLSKEELPTYGDLGQYCLLEFPLREIPPYTKQVVFSLQVKGLTPIIAHPERYVAVVKDPNVLLPYLENGCLIQVNSPSLLGIFGTEVEKTAERLMDSGFVHLIASDAHSSGRRGFNLHLAGDKLAAKGWDKQRLMEDNPRRILQGRTIQVGSYKPYKPPRRFWIFGR